jgi:alkyl hydroperoxide reductase subunit F
VIVATGARWRNMNVPGEEQYRTKGVAYCPHCDGPLFKGKRRGRHRRWQLGHRGRHRPGRRGEEHVTLLEFADQLKADAGAAVDKLKSLPNVTIHVNAQTTRGATAMARRSPGMRWKDRVTGAEVTRRSSWKASSCRSASCPTPSG